MPDTKSINFILTPRLEQQYQAYPIHGGVARKRMLSTLHNHVYLIADLLLMRSWP